MPIAKFTDKELLKHYHEMVDVEGGIFEMGSEDPRDSWGLVKSTPVHTVELSSFQIGKYPVTQSLWELVMDSNPSDFRGKRRPVESVLWDDTQVFIEKLSILTDKIYRLPTEAEWEYAAKGGKYQEGFVYSGSNDLDAVAWYEENNDIETMPVGMKSPNVLGIYDMSGNVWEWCQDWYSHGYYEVCQKKEVVKDPKGARYGRLRVNRGGGWLNSVQPCRIAYRYQDEAEFGNYLLGFRLAL